MNTFDQNYENKLKVTLENFLARPASKIEIDSADSDTELTVRVIYDLLKELEARVVVLENKTKLLP